MSRMSIIAQMTSTEWMWDSLAPGPSAAAYSDCPPVSLIHERHYRPHLTLQVIK